MKPSCINSFALSTVVATIGCALGCGPSSGVDGSSSSSSSGCMDAGSGDAYNGLPCLWTENDAGLSFPVCPAPETSEFMGTIDGKPYDAKTSGAITAMAIPFHPPYGLSMQLAGGGSLDLIWGDPYIRGQWTYNTTGDIILPDDPKVRGVFGDSHVLLSCDAYSFLYILHVDGGDLTGCSR